MLQDLIGLKAQQNKEIWRPTGIAFINSMSISDNNDYAYIRFNLNFDIPNIGKPIKIIYDFALATNSHPDITTIDVAYSATFLNDTAQEGTILTVMPSVGINNFTKYRTTLIVNNAIKRVKLEIKQNSMNRLKYSYAKIYDIYAEPA